MVLSLASLSQEVILTAGNSSVSSTSTLHWTLGQIVTGTEEEGSTTLIQGFHQSTVIVTNIYDVERNDCEIDIYPNPVTDILSVKVKSALNKPISAHIINSFGKKVQVIPSIKRVDKVDVSKLPQGIYHISFYYDNLLQQTYKIIVL